MKWRKVPKNSKVAPDSGKLICGLELPNEAQGQLYLTALSSKRPPDIVLVTDEDKQFYATAEELLNDFARWAGPIT